ncbi:MAG: hypothetical protein LBR98_02500 [Syntrophomonadaceae bacterium]|jgi:hypothetical protein|nr:hypothetical protein [Syntrophomonadaceae bacterium]
MRRKDNDFPDSNDGYSKLHKFIKEMFGDDMRFDGYITPPPTKYLMLYRYVPTNMDLYIDSDRLYSSVEIYDRNISSKDRVYSARNSVHVIYKQVKGEILDILASYENLKQQVIAAKEILVNNNPRFYPRRKGNYGFLNLGVLKDDPPEYWEQYWEEHPLKQSQAYIDIRGKALSITPGEMGITLADDRRIYAGMVDLSVRGIFVSLVCRPDGNIRLYYSIGHLYSDLEKSLGLRQTATDFLSGAEQCLPGMKKVRKIKAAWGVNARFYMKTRDCIRTIEYSPHLRNSRKEACLLYSLFIKTMSAIVESQTEIAADSADGELLKRIVKLSKN